MHRCRPANDVHAACAIGVHRGLRGSCDRHFTIVHLTWWRPQCTLSIFSCICKQSSEFCYAGCECDACMYARALNVRYTDASVRSCGRHTVTKVLDGTLENLVKSTEPPAWPGEGCTCMRARAGSSSKPRLREAFARPSQQGCELSTTVLTVRGEEQTFSCVRPPLAQKMQHSSCECLTLLNECRGTLSPHVYRGKCGLNSYSHARGN